MRGPPSAAPWLLSAFLVGCATDGAVEQELSRMRRDLHGMQEEMRAQRLEFERLESRVTLLSLGGRTPRAKPTEPIASAAPRSRRSASSSDVRPQEGPGRVLPVVRMSSKAEPGELEVVDDWDHPGAQDDGSPPIVIKLGPSASASSSSERLTVDHGVLAKPDPVLSSAAKTKKRPAPENKATKAQIRRAYDDALATLRDQDDARGALAQFEAFVEAYPKSSLADNATYWAGECHSALGQHAEAAETYAKLLRSFPRSAKVPYAKVGLGRSRIALGDKGEGRALLHDVIEQHPSSGAAEEARRYLAADGGH